ncbi:AAA family ATPase [Aurantiacibacter gangjinensis]|uniref:AAA family ATPase n=1 Tax=Aurantiacibacter gangjinensis TaxID=502682 RepID=UPI00069BC325|nr:AAA family ATPase [Aurantiacibacter gangjinensis]APE27428.1 Glycerate kinase [Aurantiacibacter gangjinensis]
MNEEGFRDWLEKNYRKNTVQTKMSEARQLNRAYGDLDQLYDEDELNAVMKTLRYSASDKADDKPNPSKVPLASDLYRDLSNLRTTVNYYRRFRGEGTVARPDVPAVNKAVDECEDVGFDTFLATYGFGKNIDYWVLRKGKRYPSKAIFGVAHQFMPDGAPLDGQTSNGTDARLHLESLGFEIVKGEAAGGPTRPFVLFDVQGAAFQPVRNGGSKGSMFKVKPKGASNRSEDAREVATLAEVARAMLIEGLPARVQSVHKGPVNYVGYGKQKLVAYELDAEIAQEIGVPPKGSVEQYDSEEDTEYGIMAQTTNLILYGPPGTGKTWSTAIEAVRLCDGVTPSSREDLMRRYHELVKARRIDFVTFHQSYSYEEFVEGMRPKQSSTEGETGEAKAGFSLEPEEGVFQRIAHRAAISRGGRGAFTIGDRQVFKLSIGEAANSEDDYLFEEALEEGHILLGYDDIDWSDDRFEERDAIIAACREYDVEHPENDRPSPTARTGRVQCPLIFRNWMEKGDIVVVSKGNSRFRAIGEITGDYEYAPRESGVYSHRRTVDWLWFDQTGAPVEDIYSKGFSMRAAYLLTRAELDFAALEGYINSQSAGSDASAPEPYVLIIDEINRGNISKIFGELITLIEPDKRAGRMNALEVRLPYSKKPFSVPPNLHLIGTMNTADRSIALLDTALRRRFVFRETPPDSERLGENVDGVPLRRVLETINDRIEYLVDREHRIGHAFFIGCTTRDEIDAVMHDKVIPLLQEYFFEDWSRVAAVLGGPSGKGGGFLDCRMLGDPTGQDGEERESWSVRKKFAGDAYARLVGTAPAESPEADEVV